MAPVPEDLELTLEAFERAGDALYDYPHWIGSSALRRQTLRGDRASGATLLALSLIHI